MQHVSSECEDITVVAYNNEIVKLLGGHEACSFQSDEDARVEAAKRLIGAIISLKLENYNLSVIIKKLFIPDAKFRKNIHLRNFFSLKSAKFVEHERN